MFFKNLRKLKNQKEEYGILMFSMAKILAILLSKRLNGVSEDSSSCYTVNVIDGIRDDGTFVMFKIERDVEGQNPFSAGFVMIEKVDFTHHHYILEITENEKDKLEAEEYRKLNEILRQVFGLYEIKKQETNFHC